MNNPVIRLIIVKFDALKNLITDLREVGAQKYYF